MNGKYAKLFLAVSAAWLMAATSASAYTGDHLMQRQARIKARLEKLGGKLAIQPAQEAAWGAFEDSVESLPMKGMKRPGRDADATSIAQFRADRAKAMAEKFAKIADATAKLESVLSEDQRRIFDEASHRSLERMRRHHMGGGRE